MARKAKAVAQESLAVFAERINPSKFNFSPRLVAMVGAVIKFDYGVRNGRGTHITSLSITSDGYLIGHGESPDVSPFLGDAEDLRRNIAVWIQELTVQDGAKFLELYAQNVDDWRTL